MINLKQKLMSGKVSNFLSHEKQLDETLINEFATFKRNISFKST